MIDKLLDEEVPYFTVPHIKFLNSGFVSNFSDYELSRFFLENDDRDGLTHPFRVNGYQGPIVDSQEKIKDAVESEALAIEDNFLETCFLKDPTLKGGDYDKFTLLSVSEKCNILGIDYMADRNLNLLAFYVEILKEGDRYP